MPSFEIVSEFEPKGHQPQAIDKITRWIQEGSRAQTLLGVTGSGKTFTVANIIKELERPALIIAHNKTLAAQLYNEFKTFLPNNAVGYFVSYYDYYQPEAYLPHTDTFIEKDASINDEIDKMRHAATHALFERRDVVIVASVSCIYGLGSPEAYHGMLLFIEPGMTLDRDKALRKLVEIQYKRNDFDLQRGNFRVRGDTVEILPVYERYEAVRIEFFGDEVDRLSVFDPITGKVLRELDRIAIYPASHYTTPKDKLNAAIESIQEELRERIQYFRQQNQLLEAQRIEQRTMFDLEMIREMGYCSGIENYSRHLMNREPGTSPPTLIDYFPDDSLIIIDECHVTLPQLHAMYNGDRARKDNLINYGFRLPSAYDNRPLKFEEFEKHMNHVLFVSATPSTYELEISEDRVAELIVRPTGLIDPPIEVRPIKGQVDDLFEEVKKRAKRNERTLITTLTKRFAEDLTEHFTEMGLRVKYLHSDIVTMERVQILRELRLGEFDALIGINLLREGLDIPEVSLIAILDADKEGFLRSATSLIQTSGRAARNLAGQVIFYAEKVTAAMQKCLDETERRRAIQMQYNKDHNIQPASIKKSVQESLGHFDQTSIVPIVREEEEDYLPGGNVIKIAEKLEKQMLAAAKNLDFEKAAELRDRIKVLREKDLGLAGGS